MAYIHGHGQDSVPHAETTSSGPGPPLRPAPAQSAPPVVPETGLGALPGESSRGITFAVQFGIQGSVFNTSLAPGMTLIEPNSMPGLVGDLPQSQQLDTPVGPSTPGFALPTDFDAPLAAGNTINYGVSPSPSSFSWSAPNPGGLDSLPHVPNDGSSKPPAKIGNRFSKEAVRILRGWMSTHESSPYLSEEDKNILQSQTGLTEIQVTNWIANARRRRNKTRGSRSSTPNPGTSTTSPVPIPARPGTPMVGNSPHADPIQRWFDSPPEDEPAAASAIARAMARRGSEGHPIDRGKNRISYGSSSASSAASSHSDSSSVMSNSSAVSWNSSSAPRKYARPRPHRKRHLRNPKAERKPLKAPFRPYQCTFCTDTFGTKHDWQRHEKSLHLSIDRWKCAPDESRVIQGEDNRPYCIFCGQADPDTEHLETHNPHVCQQRIFSRKDHLKQHLRLVHGAKLIDSFAEHWKAPSPPVKSRCGFCGIALDSWSFRVDHLADHFKVGQSIADWKGDWGFEKSVLDMVENAIPPYLISTERSTPFPFVASAPAVESPRCAYEKIKLELLWYMQGYSDETGEIPDSDALQLEACRIIFASESRTPEEALSEPGAASWLRDLITSHEDIMKQAKFGPIRSEAESVSAAPSNISKSLFHGCPLEAQLQDFVFRAWTSGQLVVGDDELQSEAYRIIMRIDKEFAMPEYDFMEKWLVGLLAISKAWLQGFRQRMSSVLGDDVLHASDNVGAGQITNVSGDAASGTSFGTLTQGDRIAQFSQPYFQPALGVGMASMPSPENGDVPISTDPTSQWDPSSRSIGTAQQPIDQRPTWVKTNFYILNDSKFHHYVTRELKRWVKATMSPNNPNFHVPSDEELRHQARFIMYDDDDIWNTTPADNCEWLRRFKCEAGIEKTQTDTEDQMDDLRHDEHRDKEENI
uniref:Homeobox domain-containing protein n=2 Tax=Bionectria ochroleuca TaxID=29856 RepID=A0A0B7K2X0_BIOOC